MIINETPIRTSKNYAINNFEISDEILSEKISKFDNFSLENFEDCEIKNQVEDLPKKFMNRELNEELNNSNLNLNIKIKKNSKKIKNLTINLTKKVVGKILFEIEKNINAKIIIKLNANSNVIDNSFIKFICHENSFVDVVLVSNLESANSNLLCMENVIEKNATMNYIFVDFAAENSVLNCYSTLQENSKIYFKNLYLADKQSKVDLNLVQDIFGPASQVQMETVGALFGEAQKSYKGTISFNKGAKKSVGEENELCMLLSNSAKSKALPMLLCQEEDVDGSHSTAIGKIDSKELFYLMSRGLSKMEASLIILKAKFNIVLNDLDENLKEEILNKVDRKIENEEL